jgi:hypothetical protein
MFDRRASRCRLPRPPRHGGSSSATPAFPWTCAASIASGFDTERGVIDVEGGIEWRRSSETLNNVQDPLV